MHLDQAIQAIARDPDRLLSVSRPFLKPQLSPHYKEKLRAYFKKRGEQSVVS